MKGFAYPVAGSRLAGIAPPCADPTARAEPQPPPCSVRCVTEEEPAACERYMRLDMSTRVAAHLDRVGEQHPATNTSDEGQPNRHRSSIARHTQRCSICFC